jgi:hypothetical protein
MHTNNKKYRLVCGCALMPLLLLGNCAEAADPEGAVPAPYRGYASAMLGNGIIGGQGASGNQTMRWRAGEIRLGHTVDFGLVSGGYISAAEAPRLDIVYYNEGHPDNNHRDGYALQMVFRKAIHPELGLELGAGPYFSQNRTTVNGIESDDGRVGALISLALIARLDAYSPGLHMRFGYNHVALGGGVPRSDALMFGLGKEIGAVRTGAAGASDGHPIWLGAGAGISQTNQSGPGYRLAYAVNAKQYYGQFAWSLSGVEEGNDGMHVNRHGIAAQAWYVQPFSENWSVSAGVGPYFAHNKLEPGSSSLNGLFSIEVDRNLGRSWKAFVNFGRAVTFRNKNDADIVTFGFMRSFGS